MKKALIITALFLGITSVASANTSGYAWSESMGWFDFSNATVSDTSVTGYAYNDNSGWLVLDGISNLGGNLSGHAWSESVGYFDFSDVSISNGSFSGYAYNDNTGWLSFEDDTNVTTTWSPPTQQSSGSRPAKKKVLIKNPTGTPSVNTPPQTNNIANNPRDLELNMTGEDVKLLQQFLNQRGYTVNRNKGQPGSAGYETNYFGNLTRLALIKFQQANNITPSIGYFGPKTRAFIKTLLNN